MQITAYTNVLNVATDILARDRLSGRRQSTLIRSNLQYNMKTHTHVVHVQVYRITQSSWNPCRTLNLEAYSQIGARLLFSKYLFYTAFLIPHFFIQCLQLFSNCYSLTNHSAAWSLFSMLSCPPLSPQLQPGLSLFSTFIRCLSPCRALTAVFFAASSVQRLRGVLSLSGVNIFIIITKKLQ